MGEDRNVGVVISNERAVEFLKRAAEALVASAICAFSFTIGYLNAFGVPEVPDFSAAGYFLLSIIHHFISNAVWVCLFNAWAWVALAFVWLVFIGIKSIFLDFTSAIIKLITPLHRKVLVLWHCSIFLSVFAVESLGDKTIFLRHGNLAEVFTIARWFFIYSLICLVAAIPLTLILEPAKSFSRTYIIFLSVLSMSFSYRLGYNYSGRFLTFPLSRSSEKSPDLAPLIWKASDTFYYLDCVEGGEWGIKGVSGHDTIYYASVDRRLTSAACESGE